MSQPPVETPVFDAPKPRRRRGPVILSVVVVIALVGGGVGVVLARSDRESTAQDEVKPIDPPAEWDPRLVEIADYVAGERGFEWDHPVPARFLNGKDFEAEVTSDERDLTDEDRQDLEDREGYLKALGLVPADFDLFGSYNDATASGTLAFYDPRKEEIVVRGTKVGVEEQVTLAHELTHALQDQQFELDQLQDDAGKTGNALALTSVVEGDASDVEDAYVTDELTDAQRQEYLTKSSSSSDEFTKRVDSEDIPEFIEVFIGAPYALGPAFVALVAARDGRRGRDDLFRADITESEILTPSRNLNDEEVIEVDDVDPPDGAKFVDDPTSFGAVGWYLMLAARLDAGEALAAVDGWAGDTSTAYERDDRRCVAAAFAGTSTADTRRMKVALQEWIAAGPKGAASVRAREGDILFETCEPKKVVEPIQSLTNALVLASVRIRIFDTFLASVPDPDVDIAWCLAAAVANDAELRPLLVSGDDPTSEQQQFITTRSDTLGRSCAAG